MISLLARLHSGKIVHPSPWIHRNLHTSHAFLAQRERFSPAFLPYSRALTNTNPFNPL